MLRALSQQQGFPAESVVRGGHGTLGLLLGVNAGTVRRWMSETRAGHGGDGGLASFIEYEGVTKYADGSVDLIVRVTRDEPVLAEHETIAASGLEALSAEPDAAAWTAQAPEPHPVMNRTAPNARSDRIRMPPDAQRGTNSPPPDAPDVRIEPQPAAYPVIFGRPSQARSVSGRKGVGGSTDFNNLERGSNTSSDTDVNGRAAQHGRDEQGKGWDLEDLLRRASVHPTTRARLQGASGVAWVSWLLYWASPLGERLIEPTGNAVNRLKEAPMAPMAGAFERLASLGPDGLAELVVPRVLSRFGYNPASQDWDDVMSGGPSDRLRRLVDLLGFDLAAWKDDDEPEELETADAGGYRRRAPSG
ncbi:MAG: hypothetical protein FJZ97_02895 [Chloroflexi bacterium]|nr:hypothetical protein [Chloroflexota bacterium]